MVALTFKSGQSRESGACWCEAATLAGRTDDAREACRNAQGAFDGGGRGLPGTRDPLSDQSASRRRGGRSRGAVSGEPGADQGAGQPEAAPAVPLAQRAGPRPAHPRCGRGRARPRHPVLGLAVLRQGRPAIRAYVSLAPGRHLLGPVVARRRHRLGGVDALARVESGCMRVVPGHAPRAGARTRTPSPRPTCSRAARRSRSTSTSNDVVDVELAPGEMSLHHVLICSTAPSRTAPSIRGSASPSATSRRTSARPRGDARKRDAGARHRHLWAFRARTARRRPTCTRTRSHGTARSSIASCASSTRAPHSAGKLGPTDAERRSGTLM